MTDRTQKKPVERAWRLIEALAGHAATGRRLNALSTHLEQLPSTTLRDLQDLESIGLVQQVPGVEGSWRLTSRITRIAVATQAEYVRLQQRVDEFNTNYLAGTGRHH